ncbi:MAG: hypothetical protein Q8P72_03910 [Candidatus Roizmanbacteria bacterium]|nr:hypothetical protein [Candidatus Roizmanbacteria bacterium]
MVQTPEYFLPPDFLFPTVEGMQDADGLLRAVGRESTHTVLERDTVGAAVMNGSVIPLVYAASAAMEVGQFDHFADRVIFFGTSKHGKEIALHPHKEIDRPRITIIEDIADRLGVLGAFKRKFPTTELELYAAVQKPHTHQLHQNLGGQSTIKTVIAIDDVWVDSGCGMDEGLWHLGIDPAMQHYLTVLQRCSRVGARTKGIRTFGQRVAFFENQLLPWISPESPLFELMVQMEEAKHTKNPQNVLALTPQIFPVIKNLLKENPFLH